MTDHKKKTPGYIPLTCHGLEIKSHGKPVQPYHKFMAIEQRVKECEKNFGVKKQVEKGK